MSKFIIEKNLFSRKHFFIKYYFVDLIKFYICLHYGS
jgi:hypothetical protein